MPPPNPLRAQRLANLSARQDLVLSRGQLLTVGVGRQVIGRRVQADRWQVVGPHVVVLHSGPLSRQQQHWAGVLHAGKGAALGGLTALEAGGLTGFCSPEVHVWAPHGTARRDLVTESVVIRVTESRTLTDQDVRRSRRPPRVRQERATVDAASTARSDRACRAILSAASQQRLVVPTAVRSLVLARPNLRRHSLILETLGDVEGGSQPLPELDYVRGLRRYRRPLPTRQRVVALPDGRYYLDADFEEWLVTVEINGVQHLTQRQKEIDDIRLTRLGSPAGGCPPHLHVGELHRRVTGWRSCDTPTVSQLRQPGGRQTVGSWAYLQGSEGAITPEPPEERRAASHPSNTAPSRRTRSLDPAAGHNRVGRADSSIVTRPRRVVPRGPRGGARPRRTEPRPFAGQQTDEGATPVTPRRYTPIPPQVDLPAMEREILELWRDNDTFAKSLAATEQGEPWTFYEGPPTANGQPGVHHVEARVFKDVFPRFKTMQGRHVVRKAGWDCHGLPVEIAVEKELGFSGKGDIEAYGVAEFNQRCRESVERHVDEFTAMTLRMGYWVDMSTPYRTMDTDYIESVWWSLKQVFDRGLLVQDHRVAPYCPRCGTGLSDHELAQGYETVVDPSVYVHFPLTSGPYAGQGSLLVWTTTPWTLVSNTAVAVRPDVTYVTARRTDSDDGELLVVAEPLLDAALGEGWQVLDRFAGKEMEHWSYDRPFDLVDWPKDDTGGHYGHFVVLADYVTTDDGTGLVHQSPAFGAEDLAVSRVYGLPVVNPVRPDGHFQDSVRLVGGQFFKSADAALVADLQSRGLLFRQQAYEHAYPHCWRCHTALLYYAQPSWYIRTTAIKDELLAENERTNWFPDNIKHGRYGDWLENNIDWALSRSRYWGTPLPIWVNDEDPSQLVCVGSLAELGELAGRDLTGTDPHRPFVDDITFSRPGVPGTFRRVPEVIDGWYDSGAMPFAQWGYPHAPGSKERFDAAYPAQFICEAIDQTRGWFYTLMAIGTLVQGRSSYENVLCLGHILAEDGRKMSKHLGNILLPVPLMEEHGADALRWFMAASGSPWLQRRVGHAFLQDIVRKTLLTYWNTASFLTLYATANDWAPGGEVAPLEERPLLDRWAISETHRLVHDVTAAYEVFDSQRVGRLLAEHIDVLSNWYVRRSRRRFWDGDPAALATLHECLYVVTLLLAPITPFVTERVWQDVVRPVSPDLPESVHLAAWPKVGGGLVDGDLAEQVALVRRVVELGRAARAESKVRNRQPLGRALVGAPGWDGLPDELKAQVADELNVLAFEQLSGELVEHSAKGNFRTLGKRFGPRTPTVAAAVAAADATRLAESLRERGTATVSVDGEDVEVSPEEVIVTETPRQGWAVVTDGGETVALDLTMTPELRRAGLAREVVRLVQEARKSAGFDVTDRIALRWQADGELADALREHADAVAAEVLAVEFEEAGPGGLDAAGPAAGPHEDADLGLRFSVTRMAQ